MLSLRSIPLAAAAPQLLQPPAPCSPSIAAINCIRCLILLLGPRLHTHPPPLLPLVCVCTRHCAVLLLLLLAAAAGSSCCAITHGAACSVIFIILFRVQFMLQFRVPCILFVLTGQQLPRLRRKSAGSNSKPGWQPKDTC
jgi:hypothetical protein